LDYLNEVTKKIYEERGRFEYETEDTEDKEYLGPYALNHGYKVYDG
jgi:hypothetical protein